MGAYDSLFSYINVRCKKYSRRYSGFEIKRTKLVFEKADGNAGHYPT